MGPLSAVVLLGLAALANAVLPDNYQNLTAKEKQNILWSQISANPYPLDKFPPNLPDDDRLLDVKFLTEVFIGTSDELAVGRPKIISPFGIACKSELVISPDSPYTGIYKSGGVGILRLSSNGGAQGARLTPFLAVKVLVNGQRSQNMHTGYNVTGQITGNTTSYWSNPYSTGYDVSTVDPLPFIVKFAQTLQDVVDQLDGGPLDRPVNIGNLGQVEQSSVTWDGKAVPKADVRAPWLVQFQPNPAFAKFAQTEPNYSAQLIKQIPADSMLFTVHALRSPCDDKYQKIGELWCRSGLTASNYEDQVLRFQQSRRQWEPAYITAGPACNSSTAPTYSSYR